MGKKSCINRSAGRKKYTQTRLKKLIIPRKRQVTLIKIDNNAKECTNVLSFPPKNKKCVNQRNPTDFEIKVYIACSRIPKGYVSTYGNLSKFLGSAPRAVGGALRRNPYFPLVPCHRVVTSNLELGGFHGTWGAASKEVRVSDELLC